MVSYFLVREQIFAINGLLEGRRNALGLRGFPSVMDIWGQNSSLQISQAAGK